MKIKKSFIVFFIILAFIFSNNISLANNTLDEMVEKTEYSDAYKKWEKLTEEEKKNVLQPRKYDVKYKESNAQYLKTTKNILKINTMMRESIASKYTLQDIIGDNVKIKNQKTTNTCWCFAALGTLESNLALADVRASKSTVLYDFSESHMHYATIREAFLNNQINQSGYTRDRASGGNFMMAAAYLTNGSGAIEEKDMPFEGTTKDINIAEIQNKDIATTVYDTLNFETVDTTDSAALAALKLQMKQYITNYGGIYAGIHGAGLYESCYNNNTGAIYCNDTMNHLANHAVVIIGWNDEYSKDNFNEGNKPTNNGAWIIKNSWGAEKTKTLQQAKEDIYENKKEECIQNGWNTATDIPDDVAITDLTDSGWTEGENGTYILNIGDKGYMYVSYEDVNIYEYLSGIEKATIGVDYDKIYQNDFLGPSNAIDIIGDFNNLYIANVFNRDATLNESLDKISVYTEEEYINSKVYVNPNGTSKAKEDLQEVKLKDGETINIKPGYHTLELAEPIKLTGNSFAVVVETQQADTILLESKMADDKWANAVVNTGESFYTVSGSFEKNEWKDTAELGNESLRGNTCIKAFTKIEKVEIADLASLEIESIPNKTVYKVGENFDKTGMKVNAVYSNGNKSEITNYIIVNGTDLTKDQTSVTISYTENNITKTIDQQITVEDNPQIIEPTSSDFNSSKANVTDATLYLYSDLDKESYVKMTLKVNNIKIGSEDNDYKYYYYLSGTQGDKDINQEYWIEVSEKDIKKENDGTYSITLQIDTRNLKNAEEISKADNIYIYLKEIASLNGKQAEKINTLEVNVAIEANVMLDDERVGNIDEVIDRQIEANKKDTTISNKEIPKAGNISMMLTIVLSIIVIGGFSYYRYKNIDR